MSLVKLLISAVPLLLCLVKQEKLTASAQGGNSQFKNCRSTLFRLIGSSNVYLWVCRCENISDSRSVGLGRATYVVPKGKIRSVRSHRAFVRCQNHRRRSLEHTCFDRPDHYEQEAKKAMNTCSKAEFIDNKESRRIPSPFNFQRAKCFAEFVSLFSGTQQNGLWACVCKQPDLEVVSGRAQFSSSSAPGGNGAGEISALQDCSDTAKQQLQDVCLNSPQDFEVLALHILQTCCKRARVGSPAKFQCAAFVPKDLDALKPKDLK